MKKILSKKVAAAVLAGTLALSPLASALTPAMALAETGSITISNRDNQQVNYQAYQIFKADVSDDTNATNVTGKTETNITWASDTAKTTVETFIKGQDSSYTGTTAKDAATWLTNHISTDSASNLAAGTYTDATVNSGSVAEGLAKALVASGITSTAVSGGTAVNLDEGYWLFVSNPETVADGDSQTHSYSKVSQESGTAPILAVVGGSAVTVKEKTTPVTLDKVVSESGNNFVHAVDAQIGKTLSYQLRGTLPADYSTFDTYQYDFSDVLSKGLTADLDSVTVTVYDSAADFDATTGKAAEGKTGHVVDTSSYTKTLSGADDDGNTTLAVNITDLKKVTSDGTNVIPTTKDSVVVVSYTAKLNSDAKLMDEGNLNYAQLTYTRNPHSEGTGTTQPVDVKVFTYQFGIYKVDATTGAHTALSGVKFTMKLVATDEDDQNGDTVGKYVQEDGSLGDTAYEFTTGENGTIAVKGLDTGTYEIAEVSAPTGYNPISSFQVKIKALRRF